MTNHDGLFAGILSHLFHRQPEPPAQGPVDRPVESAEQKLSALLEEVKKRAEQARKESSPAAGSVTRKREKEERRLEAQEHLAQSIMELHRRLGTGLDSDEVHRLSDFLQGHTECLQQPEEETLNSRIEHYVLCHLYRQVGELAWQELEHFMAAASLAWPAPSDLPHTATAEEVERRRQFNRQEAHEFFIEIPAVQLADLMLGLVRVWGAAYPEPTSALWTEVGLRAVAAALRVQLYEQALAAWDTRPEELERGIARVLDKELERTRELLAQGIDSIAQADKITAHTAKVAREVVPSMVWDCVKERLKIPCGNVPC